MDIIGNGVQRDESSRNTRYDLIPPEAMDALAEVFCEGAKKYDERNWEKGIPVNNCIDHALGHLSGFLKGDTSEPHMEHALCNIAMALTMIRRGQPTETNDKARLLYHDKD